MTTEHSPLPWHMTERGGIRDAADYLLVAPRRIRRVDAALVVRAVNSHAASIAAMKLALARLDEHAQYDESDDPDDNADEVARQTLRAALALA